MLRDDGVGVAIGLDEAVLLPWAPVGADFELVNSLEPMPAVRRVALGRDAEDALIAAEVDLQPLATGCGCPALRLGTSTSCRRAGPDSANSRGACPTR